MTTVVACIDVGQGDCTVAVDARTGGGLLIDCPSGRHIEVIEEFDQLALRELRSAIVSHSHLDHLGGVLDLLEALGERFTGNLYFNQDSLMAVPVAGPDRAIQGRKLRALINRASELGERVRRAEAGTDFPHDVGEMTVRLVAPSYQDVLAALGAADPNRASGIIVIEDGALKVVVGGDAPLTVWNRVAPGLPRGAAVRWPHHGGRIDSVAGAHERLLEILEPSTVIVSVGGSNPYGHPSPEFFDAVSGKTARLLCTEATAACALGGGSPGRCAGTVRLHAEGSGPVAVDTQEQDHAARVRSLASARCGPASEGGTR